MKVSMELHLMVGLWGYFLMGQVLMWASAHSGKVKQLEGVAVHPENGTKVSPSDNALESTEVPLNSDRCRGYYDVMGQWDPPFNCNAGTYLYCCGTCGYRFCCEFKHDRLDQSTCSNYDTPNWANTGKPPVKVDDNVEDPAKDKTNMIVYIICGVVAIMVLVGIFTKLGLEKARGPQTEMNMSRALTDLLKQQGNPTMDCIERDGSVGAVQVPITDSLSPRSSRNSAAETAADEFYSKRYPVMELPVSGAVFPTVKDRQPGEPCAFLAATPRQKTKVSKTNTHPLFSSGYKGWEQGQPLGQRQAYASKRQYSIEHLPEIFSPPLHYKQPQRHLSTNSKTEVTV
ncbi:protein shisa-9-like isoform X3 [Pristis pectinata]|uniref:protein shisa-9-like isoform X3 n=1 Tax=Pristis pectinata TaxID=685728 RepID=UPI00223CD85A|nr:protein shisa-9-like isoform X3 [Pristis pectinata]